MKKLLSVTTIAAMAIGISAFAFAQDAGPKGPQGAPPKSGGKGQNQRGWGRMAQVENEVLAKVKLTAAQKKSVKTLQEETAAKLKALIEKPGERQEKGKEMRKIREDHQNSLMKILDKTQQAQYRELYMAKMKELREQRQKNGGGGGGSRIDKP
jgi:hypothetical protein